MPLRRANGTGTVYKLRHAKLRKPYRAVITLGYDENGKAKRKSLGTFAKAKDAWAVLSQYIVDPSALETKEVLFKEAWAWMIEDKKRQGVDIKKGSYDLAEKRLQPLMNLPLQNIKLAHLQAIIDDYSHLSRSSIMILHKAMNGTFNIAIKNDAINKNYAKFVTLPPIVKSTIHKPFTEEEICQLWKHEKDPIVQIALIYLYTGMRPVELPKITIDNVHLDKSYMIGGVKTTAGRNRIIPIANCIKPFVQQAYNLARFKKENSLSFPIKLPFKTKDMKSITERIGISEHLPHDTRHGFITLASNIGIDTHIVKLIVGHSTTSDITADVYTHKNINQLVEAVNQIPHHEELLRLKTVSNV